MTGFQIAGPNARAVLAACCREDVSNDALPFLGVRKLTVGMADCLVQRVSYTGDLGFEIYCDPMSQRQLWSALWTAGEQYGMTPFGMRAMMSLRLDRFFGSWQREYSPDYTAAETGLDRFIAFKKPVDFIGRAAAELERKTGPSKVLCMFEVDAEDADVLAWEPIWLGKDVVGFCTSGGYSHWTGKSLAFGFLPAVQEPNIQTVEIEILGELRKAKKLDAPIFDPKAERIRQ
jgi:dimethylglycine dehydrogenase